MSGCQDDWNFSEAFSFLFYSPPKKEKSEKRKEKLPKLNPKNTGLVPAPARATENDLSEALCVTNVDFCIEENTVDHHTDMFDCTDVEEYGDQAELVVRRGQDFKFSVTLNMEYNNKTHDMFFEFRNGIVAETNKETYGKFQLDETKVERATDKWSGRLVKKDGCTIIAEIHIPHTCAIGYWTFIVSTITKGHKNAFQYECPDDFIILFNPWCKEDTVYIGDLENGTAEYVLNDQGAIFRGSVRKPIGKVWNFAQFDAPILEAALFVIMKCLNGKTLYRLSDPVLVARDISQAVNCCDRDNGILWGNWSGDYEDGKSPNVWIGSRAIIREYMETGRPVKYGQCWVFSGLTTTICRAVGIPARSVTNYGSAHDTDSNIDIDLFYDENLKKLSKTSDSIWNYHVWNEVWMARPDIKKILESETCNFDCWQAIDATPQEQSEGLFRCGPSPVHAVKIGNVAKVPYDGPFIFSEVNADITYWKKVYDEFVRFRRKTNGVGKAVITKVPDGKAYSKNTPGKDGLNIVDCYKYKEGSEENRNAVRRATANARRGADDADEPKKDVIFKLRNDDDIVLGEPIHVKFIAINKSENTRKVTKVRFSFYAQANNGNVIGDDMMPVEKEDKELAPQEVYEFETTLKGSDYFDKIDSGRCISIVATASVAPSTSRPGQDCAKNHEIELTAPSLDVEMPETVKKGENFEVVVSFNNPLDKKLENCTFGYESRAFKDLEDEPLSDVPGKGKFEKKFVLATKKKGKFTLTAKFNSDQLNCITGSAESTSVL